MTKQKERYQNDATTVSQNEFDSSCESEVTDYSAYESCLNGATQAVDNAESDENAATTAEQSDLSAEITAEDQIESAISTLVAQLDGMAWPSVAQPTAAALAQDLARDHGNSPPLITEIPHP